MVRRAQEMGYLIGSCSDRPPSAQQALWDKHDIQADFVVAKHLLGDVKAKFQAEEYFHIGDRDLDQQYAERAGFRFYWAYEGIHEPWLTLKNP